MALVRQLTPQRWREIDNYLSGSSRRRDDMLRDTLRALEELESWAVDARMVVVKTLAVARRLDLERVAETCEQLLGEPS